METVSIFPLKNSAETHRYLHIFYLTIESRFPKAKASMALFDLFITRVQ